jgi:hypothetical protein
MNRKGQMAISAGIVLLLTAVVGLFIVDSVTVPVTTATTVLNESLGTVYNGTAVTFANGCVVAEPTNVYDWTNATAVNVSQFLYTPQEWPDRGAQVITFASGGFDHNGTVVTVDYEYGCSYGTTPILRTVVGNLVIIAAIGVLALAGMWLWMR